jgi:hypothetical protein
MLEFFVYTKNDFSNRFYRGNRIMTTNQTNMNISPSPSGSNKKTISQPESTEKTSTMTTFTSIKNIPKNITVFMSTHTHDFAYEDIIEKLSNSSDVYGVDSDTKLTKRQKKIKKVVQTTATEFVEMYKGMVQEFPSEMSDPLKLTIIKALWADFEKTAGFGDKLRTKPVKSTNAVFNKSAYMYFCDEHRLKMKESNPEMSPSETTKSLGALWSLTKSSRKSEHDRFVKMASDNHVVDEEKEKAIEEKRIGIAERKAEKEKATEDKVSPVIKRAKSPFVNFSDITTLESADDEDFISLSKNAKITYIKELWADLSVEQKADYKFPIPVVATDSEPEDSGIEKKMTRRSKFIKFMTEVRLVDDSEFTNKSEKEQHKQLKKQWSEYSDEEKQKFA